MQIPSDSAKGEASPTLLRIVQVKAKTGLSHSEIYRRIALGSFPAPVPVGIRAVAWVGREIDQWILERINARNQKAAA
jgi:prophage regulatory protein